MVMLALQKAFDSEYHDILPMKRKALGFNELAIKWIVILQTDRAQSRFKWSAVQTKLDCVVQQRSELRQLFVLLYRNDLKSACPRDPFLYSDDYALLVSHKH